MKRKMEEGGIKEESLAHEFNKLVMELRSQSSCSHVTQFSGESSEKYSAWVKSLERVLVQLGGDDARAQILALQTTSGPAGDYVTRVYNENPRTTWEELKKKMKARYSDLADLAYARHRLRRLTQLKSESVQNFHERVLTAAQEVFDSNQLKQEYIQQQIVEFFLDGLASDVMARRLIRLKVTKMDEALEHALAEQQAQKSFDLRRGNASDASASNPEHTPMEVDALTSTPSEMAKMTALLQEVLTHLKRPVPNNPPNNLPPRDRRPRDNRDIRCYSCHRLGHIASQCRSRQYPQNNRNGLRPTYADVAARPPNNNYRGQGNF